MKQWHYLALVVLLGVLGCSTGTGIPTAVDESSARDVSMTPSHQLLGMYKFTCDVEAQTLDIIPLRLADFHLNALPFLEPPPNIYLTLESLEFNGDIIETDIGLRHPFLGLTEFTGFDVCGILITNGGIGGFNDPDLLMPGTDDFRLLNPDGYSRWWNPAEFPNDGTIFGYTDGLLGTPDSLADFSATLNGYKYFCDDLGPNDPLSDIDPASRSVFGAGQKNIRHYTIETGSEGLIFNYAVDACWIFPEGELPWTAPDDFPAGANRPEAYNIVITELDNSLFYDDFTGYAGGLLKLRIDVYDHFNASLNQVHAESFAGLPFTSTLTPTGSGLGYSTYQLDLAGDDLTQNGDAELLITVQSEISGYGGLLPDKPVCAYFTRAFNISSQPITGWARTWGGPEMDACEGNSVDSYGYIYTTGCFEDTVDFDPGDGVDERTSNGGKYYADTFLTKYDAYGNYQWARTWGGTANDYGYDTGVDSLGNVYVLGKYMSGSVDFDPGEGEDIQPGFGEIDVFMSKFNSDGVFQWARTWGSGGFEQGTEIAVDSSDNLYIIGWFGSSLDFDPGAGEEIHSPVFSSDVYLSKFDSDGIFLWVRCWGGHGIERGEGIAVDDNGNIFTTGWSNGTVDFDPGPGEDILPPNGYCDAWLSKLNSDGDFQWARRWGAAANDYGREVAVDSYGCSYTTGWFRETVNFDTGGGTDERESNGDDDVYLVKYDPDGDYLWARTWGASLKDYGYRIACDGSTGFLYASGYFYSSNVDFDPGTGSDVHSSNGNADIYLSKFDLDGNFQWARTWGAGGHDRSTGVLVDGLGNIIVSGWFVSSIDFDPGPESEIHASHGHYDAFLMKLMPDGYW